MADTLQLKFFLIPSLTIAWTLLEVSCLLVLKGILHGAATCVYAFSEFWISARTLQVTCHCVSHEGWVVGFAHSGLVVGQSAWRWKKRLIFCFHPGAFTDLHHCCRGRSPLNPHCLHPLEHLDHHLHLLLAYSRVSAMACSYSSFSYLIYTPEPFAQAFSMLGGGLLIYKGIAGNSAFFRTQVKVAKLMSQYTAKLKVS